MRKVLLASAAAIPDVRPPQPQKPDTVLEKIARSAARPREGVARQRRRPSRSARRGTGGDGDDDDEDAVESGGEGEPDALVADPQVAREFSVSLMTIWRWDHDANLGFPPRIVVGRRNYRSRQQLERFKRRLLRRAIAQRAREARG
jgi:hypothetical protein